MLSNFRLLRIDENVFCPNPEKTFEEIENWIFNSTEKITLFGDRYSYLQIWNGAELNCRPNQAPNNLHSHALAN